MVTVPSTFTLVYAELRWEAAWLCFAFSGESTWWLHLVPGICGGKLRWRCCRVCVFFFGWSLVMLLSFCVFSSVFSIWCIVCLCLFQFFSLWVSVLFFLVQRCFFDVLNFTIIHFMQWFSCILLFFSGGLIFFVIELPIISGGPNNADVSQFWGLFIYLLSVVFLPRGWIFETLQCVWIYLLLSDLVLNRTERIEQEFKLSWAVIKTLVICYIQVIILPYPVR